MLMLQIIQNTEIRSVDEIQGFYVKPGVICTNYWDIKFDVCKLGIRFVF